MTGTVLSNTTTRFVVPERLHFDLVVAAFAARGYDEEESKDMARLCGEAARHGIRTHNALKALHLEEHFGASTGGCRPGAPIEELPSRFPAARVWNANRKLGPSVAYRAIETCICLADEFGVGMVSVDSAWHYLWGGGYVLEAAKRGYLAYTNCTAMLAEVVPFGGRTPTLGTNPHSWAFPTTEAVGFPILIDWATSAVAMGRVQELKREGRSLPSGCALDGEGQPTTDPSEVRALLPFGTHKGYGLGLIDELTAALIGGSLPTMRGRFANDAEKRTPCFFFQVIHPDALGASYAGGLQRNENLRRVILDILGHGNEQAILPGEIEARNAALSKEHGGFLFTPAELDLFDRAAVECGWEAWDRRELHTVGLAA
jgi:L-2-hydroxycarboxylate dehydrogenase (NAD+)